MRQLTHILDSMAVVQKLFSIVYYKDGSKIDNRVTFASVNFENGVEIDYNQFRTRNECILYISKLQCIGFTVKWISSQDRCVSKYLICIDSLSFLESLQNTLSCNDIIVEIQLSLGKLQERGEGYFSVFYFCLRTCRDLWKRAS